MRKGYIKNPDELVKEDHRRRIDARRFIAESCEIAKTLNPRQKILFLLHFDHGYSNKELGELCQCSEKAVSMRINRIAKEINIRRKLLRQKSVSKVSSKGG